MPGTGNLAHHPGLVKSSVLKENLKTLLNQHRTPSYTEIFVLTPTEKCSFTPIPGNFSLQQRLLQKTTNDQNADFWSPVAIDTSITTTAPKAQGSL